MAQCDGRGFISLGLLEKVGETMGNLDNPRDDCLEESPQASLCEQMAEMQAEIEGLQAVVIAQCEAISQMVPAPMQPERSVEARMAELEENWTSLGDYVADVLSEIMGSSNPASLTTCPLPSVRALAEFVRDA